MQSVLEIGGDLYFSEFLSGLVEEVVKYDFYFVMVLVFFDDEFNVIKWLIVSGYVDVIFLVYVIDLDLWVVFLCFFLIFYFLYGWIMGEMYDYFYFDVDNEGVFYMVVKFLL